MSPRRTRITSPGTSSRAGRSDPLAVTLHPGVDRQLGLQGGDRVAGLALLPEPDDGVGAEQHEDDAEVRPVPGDRREDHRRLDHPGNGTPKVGKELQQWIGLLLLDLVRPVLGQALLRLGLREAVRRRPQSLLHFRQRQRLQVVVRAGLRRRPRFRLGFGGMCGRCHRRSLSSTVFIGRCSTSSCGLPAGPGRACR